MGSWVFSQLRGVGDEKGWKEKARSLEGFGGPESCRERRAVAAPRCGGRFGVGWWAYGTVVRVAESRYGTPGFGVQAVLRGMFREGSGAGVREVLGRPWKGFASWAYRAVPDGSNEGRGNLTGRLTACLTTSLTAHLTRSLTKSGVPSGREGGQTGLRDRLEAVSAFPLGGVEHFCHDAVVDSQSLLDDSFP